MTIQAHKRSLFERIIHAAGFEVVAVSILAPVGSWLLGRSMLHIGVLAISLSATAMIWNVIYNAIFDRLWPVTRVERTVKVRALHALGFESGFILLGTPVAAFILSVPLLEALVLEIGFFLFFLPYTMFYNWVYDCIRARVVHYSNREVITEK